MTRRGLLSLYCVALAGCMKPPTRGGLYVTVDISSGAASRCVQVIAKQGPDTELRTQPMVIAGKAQLEVGIGQGTLASEVTVFALGFSDDGCTTPTAPAERSRDEPATFEPGVIHTVMLTLPAGARSEAGLCADAQDNDADGKVDCADSDCLGEACAPSNLCTAGAQCDAQGGCSGGAPKVCNAPLQACRRFVGACEAATGACTYPLEDAGVRCDDQSACTALDTCSAAGDCAGQPLSCDRPPGQCFADAGATCDPLRGCEYAVRVAGSCDDHDRCTSGDTCAADGGCAGAQVTCTPGECQLPSGGCDPDAGCVFDARDAGTACDGGICNVSGGCIALFPYAPSNFTEIELSTPPGDVTLGCGETTIDTGGPGMPTFTGWCANQPLPGVSIVAQPGATDAVLLSFSRLTVEAGALLRIRGARPLIVAATTEVAFAGLVEVTAGARDCSDGGAGRPGGSAFNSTQGGAGGGTLTTPGGSGGDGASGGSGGVGGVLDVNELAVPLYGGCAGGLGGGSSVTPGAGGGALQVSSAGLLSVSGTISAPGQGGPKSPPTTGGNGGGSGGVVLLEAVQLTFGPTATVVANGGGGGEGAGVASTGDPGQPGRADAGSAAGGNSLNSGGPGGNGAAGGVSAGTGGTGTFVVGNGGAGGGGLGRVRMRAMIQCSAGPGVTFSPAPNVDAGC